MKKAAQAVLAASTGVVLLLGGAGTLAYWGDSETVPGSAINGGTLDIVTDTVNLGCGSWSLDGVLGSTSFVSADKLVPGDVLTKTCKFTITATGNHMKATIGLSTPSFSGTAGNLGGMLSAAVTSDVAGTPVSAITSADDGRTLTAKVQVTWNAADTLHQAAQTVLDDLTLTATQTHS